jgi:hypothetical protein
MSERGLLLRSRNDDVHVVHSVPGGLCFTPGSQFLSRLVRHGAANALLVGHFGDEPAGEVTGEGMVKLALRHASAVTRAGFDSVMEPTLVGYSAGEVVQLEAIAGDGRLERHPPALCHPVDVEIYRQLGRAPQEGVLQLSGDVDALTGSRRGRRVA